MKFFTALFSSTLLVLSMSLTFAESAPKKIQPLSFTLADGVILKLMPIPAGKFKMGSLVDEKDRWHYEDQVDVTISRPFWMGETLFTQGQWQSVMGNNPSGFKGETLPVETVSWEDCQKCVTKLNEMFQGKLPVGYRFALPTEAQWEYACRAGTRTSFHFGNDLESTMANFNGNNPVENGRKGIFREKTTPVKTFWPNAWGLYDMHGNVQQWCEDWFGDKYSGGADPVGVANPIHHQDPAFDKLLHYRILRGGGWIYIGVCCRSARRDSHTPDTRCNFIGFRVALSLPQPIK